MGTYICFDCDCLLKIRYHEVAYVVDTYYCSTCFMNKNKCSKCLSNEARNNGMCKKCKNIENIGRTKQKCEICKERLHKCMYCKSPVIKCRKCVNDEYESVYCDYCI